VNVLPLVNSFVSRNQKVKNTKDEIERCICLPKHWDLVTFLETTCFDTLSWDKRDGPKRSKGGLKNSPYREIFLRE
jgi:hypothetical protein